MWRQLCKGSLEQLLSCSVYQNIKSNYIQANLQTLNCNVVYTTKVYDKYCCITHISIPVSNVDYVIATYVIATHLHIFLPYVVTAIWNAVALLKLIRASRTSLQLMTILHSLCMCIINNYNTLELLLLQPTMLTKYSTTVTASSP